MASLIEEVGIGNDNYPEFGSLNVNLCEFSRVRCATCVRIVASHHG